MSTPSAPASEPGPERRHLKPYAGRVIRMVEGQHRISTNRLAGTLAEQALLEALVEEVKPVLPEAARALHFLLATPFRYGHKQPSRFRRADERPGIFYASETIAAAVAEAAYWRILFFSRSPGTLPPGTTTEYTSFSIAVRAERAIDLTRPPFDAAQTLWTAEDYGPCQRLATAARAIETQAIRYRSARDPEGGMNVAMLDPSVFEREPPRAEHSWHFRFADGRLSALAGLPSPLRFSFDFAQFGLTASAR